MQSLKDAIEAGKRAPDAKERRAAIGKLVATAHELVGENAYLREVFIDAILHTKTGGELYRMAYDNGFEDGEAGEDPRIN